MKSERERELKFWSMWGDDGLSAIKIVSNHWSLNRQRAHCNECILCDQLQQCRGYASSANVSAHVDHAFDRCICIVDAGSRFCVYQCPRTRYVKFYDRKCGPFKIYDSCSRCQESCNLEEKSKCDSQFTIDILMKLDPFRCGSPYEMAILLFLFLFDAAVSASDCSLLQSSTSYIDTESEDGIIRMCSSDLSNLSLWEQY